MNLELQCQRALAACGPSTDFRSLVAESGPLVDAYALEAAVFVQNESPADARDKLLQLDPTPKLADLAADLHFLTGSWLLGELANKKALLSGHETAIALHLLNGDAFQARRLLAKWDAGQYAEYAQLVCGTQLVPREAHRAFLAQLGKSIYFNKILQHCSPEEPYLAMNIARLPRYYTLIRLDRVRSLLQTEANVEKIVFDLIVLRQLPEGTRIDQVAKIVDFGQPPLSRFDQHVSSVCALVDSLSEAQG